MKVLLQNRRGYVILSISGAYRQTTELVLLFAYGIKFHFARRRSRNKLNNYIWLLIFSLDQN
jgi:hypothetical protein